MKKILFLLLLLLVFNRAEAQISLFIKEMKVFQSNVTISKDHGYEGQEDGPSIDGLMLFENNTDSTITLYPSQSSVLLTFRYNMETYSQSIFFAFSENERILIQPKQSKEVFFDVNLFLGTKILKSKPEKLDYTKELLEVLPTIRILYHDSNNSIESIGILNVKIIQKVY